MNLEEKGTQKLVLIVCSDPTDSQVIEEVTRGCMLEGIICPSLAEARAAITKPGVALVFCDDVWGQGSYRDLLNLLPKAGRRVPLVVVMSEENRDQTYRDAMEQGAFDVIASPCTKQDVQWVVIRAMDLTHLPRSAARG
jgi:DNA-binding NtrC family response regulator